jgi:predicted amidophosphoribosyltransferase
VSAVGRRCGGSRRHSAHAAARRRPGRCDVAPSAPAGGWRSRIHERGLRRLSAWAADVVIENVARPEATCLAAVPGDLDRRLERGHHAAERLARELAAAWELPYEPLLRRTPGSRRQRGLTEQERRRNVAGAFLPRGPVPARIALVDDVYTTGATVNAAASALRKAGATGVEVVTFARAIRIR